MHPPLSVSKIIPPDFPHVLLRPRLLDRLEQQRQKKLILILGQAAQGKSTLALSYANTSKIPSAWLNLGPEDSEAVNLFYLLVQSLQRALPEVDLTPLLSYPTLPAGPREKKPLYRDWLLTLLSRMQTPVQVVFDGLDRLAPQAAAFHFLQVMLEVAPPHLRLLMLSREMPPLKLQELKVRQEIHLVRNEELAFTPKETRMFFQTVRKLLVPYDLMAQISDLTEGWIGGLILLSEILERLPEESRESFLSREATEKFTAEVSGYFEESIFSSRPPEIQEFLVKSSILDIVDPDFIRDYLGVGNARDILEDLSARNLFVQLIFDKQRGWFYRYHQLFKDFLQAKFQAALSPEQQVSAYLRAGSLLEDRGDLESAVDFYLQAGAKDLAVAAIEQVGLQLLKQAKTAELARWLQNLPDGLVQDRPWLLFYYFITGRTSGAAPYISSLLRAYTLFQKQEDLRGLLLTLSHLLELAIFVGFPGLPRVTTLLNQAEDLLQRAESQAFPYESAALWFQVGMAHMFVLHIRQGYQACFRASLLAKDTGDRYLEIHALLYCRLMLTSVGEFVLAQETAEKIEELLATWSSPELQVHHLVISSIFSTFRGELEEGVKFALMAQQQTEQHGLAFLYPLTQLYRLISLGHAERYAEAVQTGLNLLHLPTPPGKVTQAIALMELAIFHYHTGDLAAARDFAAQARKMMSSDEARGEYHLRLVQMTECLISYHLEELEADTELKLEKILAEVTGITSYLFMADAHWILALWQWRQGRLEEAAAHIKAGMEVAARRGSYYSILLSPRDQGRIFTLALELDLEEVWESLPPQLSRWSRWVGPDLERLSRHANPKIAVRAGELRRVLHRQGLPRLDIRTLGAFQVRRNREPLDEAVWERKQPKLLLKALLAHGGEAPKEVLLEDLWPEGEPEITEKHFRVSLHRFRKAVEPCLDKTFGSSYIHLTDGLLSLDRELCRVDVDEFFSLQASGEELEEQGNLSQALALYKKAVDLYGGDFLPEELYLPWAEKRREELRGIYLELLERVSQIYEKQGAVTRAIKYCQMIIQTDPVSESTYRRLMTLYLRRGLRSEALKTFENCRKALARNLEAEPDAVTTAIFRKIQESD
jgi:ATP/maltotriose-dependent transcriptional regulator MalT/two-component SAPR family response regulator